MNDLGAPYCYAPSTWGTLKTTRVTKDCGLQYGRAFWADARFLGNERQRFTREKRADVFLTAGEEVHIPIGEWGCRSTWEVEIKVPITVQHGKVWFTGLAPANCLKPPKLFDHCETTLKLSEKDLLTLSGFDKLSGSPHPTAKRGRGRKPGSKNKTTVLSEKIEDLTWQLAELAKAGNPPEDPQIQQLQAQKQRLCQELEELRTARRQQPTSQQPSQN